VHHGNEVVPVAQDSLVHVQRRQLLLIDYQPDVGLETAEPLHHVGPGVVAQLGVRDAQGGGVEVARLDQLQQAVRCPGAVDQPEEEG